MWHGTEAVSYTHLDVYKRQLCLYPVILLQYSIPEFSVLLYSDFDKNLKLDYL